MTQTILLVDDDRSFASVAAAASSPSSAPIGPSGEPKTTTASCVTGTIAADCA